MLDSWTWEEYKDYKKNLEGFVGENEQAKVFLTIDTKRANGTWYQTILFQKGIVGFLEKDDKPDLDTAKWIPTKQVLLMIPEEWWSKVYAKIEKCYKKAQIQYNTALQEAVKDLEKLESASKVLLDYNLEELGTKTKELKSKTEALYQISQGDLHPGQWNEEGPKKGKFIQKI